jgi:hypothetical protein
MAPKTWISAVALACATCGGSPAPAPSAPTTPPPAIVSYLRLHVRGLVDGHEVPVLSGDSLRAGDKLWFEVSSTKPGFVSAFRIDGAGALLFIGARSVHVAAGATARFPDRGELVLADAIEGDGLDDTYFLLSDEDLSDADDRAVLRALNAHADATGGVYLFTTALAAHRADYARMARSRAVSVDRTPVHDATYTGVSGPMVARFTVRRLPRGTAPRLAARAAPDAHGVTVGFGGASDPDFGMPSGIARQLRARFPDRTSVVFYQHLDGALHAFVVDRDGLRAHAAVAVAEDAVAERIAELRRALLVPAATERGFALERSFPATEQVPLADAMRALDDALFPPKVRDALVKTEHLVVVPTLGIGAAPFAALEPLAPGEPLVQRMSVTIAPSLFDLWDRVDPWSYGFARPVVVGNPTFDDARLPPLPGAEAEARMVAARVGGRAWLGADANAERVLDAMPRADLVYLATHGEASTDDPMEQSVLVLAGDRSRWLTPAIIQRHATTAKLVVLSACQTGLGGVQRAGITGLARAFIFAGSPRVVMSLWSVDDASTAALMEAFLDALRSRPPADALRVAMLAMRARGAGAARWAPFIVFGSPY